MEEMNYTPQRQPLPPREQPRINTPESEEVGLATTEQFQPLVSWRASEYIHHQKGLSWFLPLAGASALLAVITYFLSGGIIGAIMVITGAIAFGMYAKQEPETLNYALFPRSIAVGNKEYSYDDFKTFSVSQSGGLFHVMLNPVKRFLPPVTIYFPKEEGELIFDILAERLPSIEEKLDPIETFMRKIRF